MVSLAGYVPSDVVRLLLTSVLVQPHKSPGTQGLIMAASLIMAQETVRLMKRRLEWVLDRWVVSGTAYGDPASPGELRETAHGQIDRLTERGGL